MSTTNPSKGNNTDRWRGKWTLEFASDSLKGKLFDEDSTFTFEPIQIGDKRVRAYKVKGKLKGKDKKITLFERGRMKLPAPKCSEGDIKCAVFSLAAEADLNAYRVWRLEGDFSLGGSEGSPEEFGSITFVQAPITGGKKLIAIRFGSDFKNRTGVGGGKGTN